MDIERARGGKRATGMSGRTVDSPWWQWNERRGRGWPESEPIVHGGVGRRRRRTERRRRFGRPSVDSFDLEREEVTAEAMPLAEPRHGPPNSGDSLLVGGCDRGLGET